MAIYMAQLHGAVALLTAVVPPTSSNAPAPALFITNSTRSGTVWTVRFHGRASRLARMAACSVLPTTEGLGKMASSTSFVHPSHFVVLRRVAGARQSSTTSREEVTAATLKAQLCSTRLEICTAQMSTVGLVTLASPTK